MEQKAPAQIIGAFEQVGFPGFGMNDLVAKVDTGAYSGALHCTQLREEEGPKGKVLRFSPFDNPELTVTATEYTTKYVRSSNGERTKRYFVQTAISIRGRSYPITLSLANRSDMKWPVLIGRKFLRQNHFLVDAGKFKP